MDYLLASFVVISVTILGAASPGPDTALLLKNSLLGSRQTAMATVFGIATGNTIYVLVALMGLGLILVQSGWVYSFVQVIGAMYLAYLGFKLLRSKPSADAASLESNVSLSSRDAFIEGLTTNLLNPKFILFLLAMFSQVIGPGWSLYAQLFLGLLIPLSACAVFSVLVFALTHPRARSFVNSIRTRVERMMGVVLLAMGIKVLVSVVK